MRLIFSSNVWEDYFFWQETDKRMLKRINKLIREAARDSFAGIGVPDIGLAALTTGIVLCTDPPRTLFLFCSCGTIIESMDCR